MTHTKECRDQGDAAAACICFDERDVVDSPESMVTLEGAKAQAYLKMEHAMAVAKRLKAALDAAQLEAQKAATEWSQFAKEQP